MASHHDLGKKGEQMAAAYLQRKQYELLHTNWTSGKKEIDIIARQGNTIVFVEVKTRSTQFFGMPEEAVNARKQELLLRAADQYLLRHALRPEHIRFDIISITLAPGIEEVTHFEDAF
ncbi:YraN family protein [Chitinophaga alhagiae]|uniref:YraN family protein n=1 Tax=Chitinophaga alhagiae TaxID=2203219 RepID=UPI000E5A2202|nr:YraN family protein [Chitinophaga alhagiae]